MASFGQVLEKIWLLFILTSGHTFLCPHSPDLAVDNFSCQRLKFGCEVPVVVHDQVGMRSKVGLELPLKS